MEAHVRTIYAFCASDSNLSSIIGSLVTLGVIGIAERIFPPKPLRVRYETLGGNGVTAVEFNNTAWS